MLSLSGRSLVAILAVEHRAAIRKIPDFWLGYGWADVPAFVAACPALAARSVTSGFTFSDAARS